MIKRFFTGVMMIALALTATAQSTKSSLRAPAYPLITIDPNTSAWSYTDELYGSTVKHWTERPFPLLGVLKVGDESYRFMGTEEVEVYALLSMGEDAAWDGKYTTKMPSGNWFSPKFDDKGWKTGKGAFGTPDSEKASKTAWNEEKIWVRRPFKLDQDLNGKTVYLEYSHDDDVVLYLDGKEIVNSGPATGKNKRVKLSPEQTAKLTRGEHLIAGYCHNTGGNGFFDVGVVVEKDTPRSFEKTAQQISVDVQAMQTHYTFRCGDVDLKITFTAPLFLDDLNLVARPVNYISYDIKSDTPREMSIYFEAAPNWALNLPSQASTSSTSKQGNLLFAKTGSAAQPVLQRSGDHINIDWGYFYLAGSDQNAHVGTGGSQALRKAFAAGNDITAVSGAGSDGHQNIAYTKSFLVNGTHHDHVMVGYDDVYSIQYFGENLRGYWNVDGKNSIEAVFAKADQQYKTLRKRADAFDADFMRQYTATGGKEYAELCALAYRQSIAAHKLVEAPNGDLMLLSKENDSNGSIGTVDVTYPSAPLYLYYNPELAKALLNFIFAYSESGKWTKPFAAHDIGTYPLANGQTYGGDMPVEESGNMLILTYAIARMEQHAKYAEKHWDVLTTWTDYLVENGLDPDNQLCTDDFAGHFAHNANLSIKAIVGIGSYAKMAAMLGKKDIAAKYEAIAKDMAAKWKNMANDGDHYRLTFDKSGTWSQKYNMVWDKLFDMGLFDKDIIDTEIAYYLTKQNEYGLPLDNRETYTKTDWICWTATMANDKATFEQFVKPVHHFMNNCTTRTPMSDWVFTDKPVRRGFKARSVVGGYFIKMLEEKIAAQ
ncbi:glutaminase family protein [Sphingobacterium corticibacter]|uniref:Glutaminase n=1 Tax=Sphingobacterium corticibacter TaxID=2171749 RepID=A0A2T8HGW0_9SPHI|nr:glutaminase family protein [Sphingobacterium corticibacter]PVH24633.1 glutaminase [Sphingobacterium corticibacter]